MRQIQHGRHFSNKASCVAIIDRHGKKVSKLFIFDMKLTKSARSARHKVLARSSNMRRLVLTSASLALLFGAAACASRPEPAPVVEAAPAPVVVATEAPAPVETRRVERAAIAPVQTGPVRGSAQDFIVNVGDRVYYDLDQYRLDSDAQDILKRQAAWLASYSGVNILVAGNADERGTREYNLALGERRASSVKSYLVDLGVDPARIQTVSYGKERPIAIGSNEAAWAQNRNGFTQIVSGATS
jgi:peptidoglycan-associated lipoprotein